ESLAAMAEVVKALDKIEEATTSRVTLVVVHHTSKESQRAHMADQGAFRGATALVDGLRFTMVLTRLDPAKKLDYALTDEQLRDLRCYSFPKTNYSAAEYEGALL